MNDHLIKAGADILAKDADQLSRTPYMYQWYRSTSSVIMQLTNGTLQVCNLINILYIHIIQVYTYCSFYVSLDQFHRSY